MREHNENEDEQISIISKKATFYKNSFVHVKLKDGWENGTIIQLGSNFLVLYLSEVARKKYNRDTDIFFFKDIKDISLYLNNEDQQI